MNAAALPPVGPPGTAPYGPTGGAPPPASWTNAINTNSFPGDLDLTTARMRNTGNSTALRSSLPGMDPAFMPPQPLGDPFMPGGEAAPGPLPGSTPSLASISPVPSEYSSPPMSPSPMYSPAPEDTPMGFGASPYGPYPGALPPPELPMAKGLGGAGYPPSPLGLPPPGPSYYGATGAPPTPLPPYGGPLGASLEAPGLSSYRP